MNLNKKFYKDGHFALGIFLLLFLVTGFLNTDFFGIKFVPNVFYFVIWVIVIASAFWQSLTLKKSKESSKS